MLAEAPRVLAIGEAHAQSDGPKAASSTRRFMDGLLPHLAPRASDLVIELWVASGECGKVEQKVKQQQSAVTAPQAATNQNDFLELGHRAKALGIMPHALVPSCEQYQKIAGAGAADIEEMLTMIKGVTQHDIEQLLTQRAPERLVVAYGGAMHNDLVPREGRADFSFGPALASATGGHYVEVDLVIPEQIKDSEAWRSLPWYSHYSREKAGPEAYCTAGRRTPTRCSFPRATPQRLAPPRRNGPSDQRASQQHPALCLGLADRAGRAARRPGPDRCARGRALDGSTSARTFSARHNWSESAERDRRSAGELLGRAGAERARRQAAVLAQGARGSHATVATGTPVAGASGGRVCSRRSRRHPTLCARAELQGSKSQARATLRTERVLGAVRLSRSLGHHRPADELSLGELWSYRALLSAEPNESGISKVFSGLMQAPLATQRSLAEVTAAACLARAPESTRFADELSWAARIGELYPGDVGVVSTLLLNLVRLEPGEAVYLPAGNLHAYLGGTGVEIMASSDNVLRGGLTPKHVNVPELLRVLDFRPLQIDPLRAVAHADEHTLRDAGARISALVFRSERRQQRRRRQRRDRGRRSGNLARDLRSVRAQSVDERRFAPHSGPLRLRFGRHGPAPHQRKRRVFRARVAHSL